MVVGSFDLLLSLCSAPKVLSAPESSTQMNLMVQLSPTSSLVLPELFPPTVSTVGYPAILIDRQGARTGGVLLGLDTWELAANMDLSS
jgi:hypothetical protein